MMPNKGGAPNRLPAFRLIVFGSFIVPFPPRPRCQAVGELGR